MAYLITDYRQKDIHPAEAWKDEKVAVLVHENGFNRTSQITTAGLLGRSCLYLS